jgi:hypothetical protein
MIEIHHIVGISYTAISTGAIFGLAESGPELLFVTKRSLDELLPMLLVIRPLPLGMARSAVTLELAIAPLPKVAQGLEEMAPATAP